MNPMNQGAKGENMDARYRTMLTLWAALLASVGLYFFLTLVIERPAEGSNEMLFWVFLAASIFPLLLSFVLKRKLLAQSVAEQRPPLVQTAMLLAVALCEAVALFGLLVFFVTRTPYYFIFFIISALGILLHLPRRDQLLAASYKGQGF
jgi:FtsH-binding integral membrane protein